MKRMFFVRHGVHTGGNLKDGPLAESGAQKITDLAAEINSSYTADQDDRRIVFCSTFLRGLHTAQLLVGFNEPIIALPALKNGGEAAKKEVPAILDQIMTLSHHLGRKQIAIVVCHGDFTYLLPEAVVARAVVHHAVLSHDLPPNASGYLVNMETGQITKVGKW
jgi:hypothetical protein